MVFLVGFACLNYAKLLYMSVRISFTASPRSVSPARNVDVGDVVVAGLKSDAVKSVKLKEYLSFEVFPEIIAGKETR